MFSMKSKEKSGFSRFSVGVPIVLVAFSVLLVGGPLPATNKSLSTRLYDQVSRVADTDNENGTTQDEWAPVYSELGLHYDAFASNPQRDLSDRQLIRYLDAHDSKQNRKNLRDSYLLPSN